MRTPIFITSIGTAVPSIALSQQQAADLIDFHYGAVLKPRSLALSKQFLLHPAISKRHIAVDTPEEIVLLKNEDPDKRMARFQKHAVALCKEAAIKALNKAGLAVSDIGAVVVNTCTGYLCPGLSTYLCEALNLSPDVRFHDLVGSGCGGALPNLEIGSALASQMEDKVVLCLSVEICSATFQMDNDLSLLLSNALFGDGAAACILSNKTGALTFKASTRKLLPEAREEIRFFYKKGQLHNRLTPELPKILIREAPPFITNFLLEQGVSLSEIAHFALHAGGGAIVDGLTEALHLTPKQQVPVRFVLENFGNLSSPSALFALERILDNKVKSGDKVLLAAFGAGLAMHAAYLEA